MNKTDQIRNIFGNVREGVSVHVLEQGMSRLQFGEIMDTLEAAIVHVVEPAEGEKPEADATLKVGLLAEGDGICVIIARVARGGSPETTLVVPSEDVIKHG